MTSHDGDRTSPHGDLGTPIYDELTGSHTAPGVDTSAPAAEPESASFTIGAVTVSTTVLDLFRRLKQLDKGSGWSGSDAMETLNLWFAEFGIDVDADETAAADAVRIPARLARFLTVLGPESPAMIVHVRTDHPEPITSVRHHLVGLVQELGEQTSVAVFDIEGDQVVSIMHGAASSDEQ
ncbi:hypothetical protein [Amycolatopsis thailandensis]|uniref:hypothetical protein n=1 Tax=Amycolatopsis thailandensis TaxID=589330 RepID=UPI00362DBFAE